jgi:hypothetical protein
MIDRLSDLLPATHTDCYAWAFLLARRLNISQAGVGYAVEKGETIVKKKAILMIEYLLNF